MVSKPDNELRGIIAQMILALELGLDSQTVKETAGRVAAMYREVFSGVYINTSEILSPPIPIMDRQQQSQLVSLSSIQFFSMCSHHFLPFYGHIALAYIPGDYIVGLGKLTRLVEVLTRRPQLQESLTDQLADQIEASLKPQGVGVYIAARHLCEAMRGTRKENQILCTSCVRGEMLTNPGYHAMFMKSIGATHS